MKPKLVASIILCIALAAALSANLQTAVSSQAAQRRNEIYHLDWIDLNKNGRMDVYENSRAPINARVEDLLRQMNLDEKTCQTATLYGVGRGRTGQRAPP